MLLILTILTKMTAINIYSLHKKRYKIEMILSQQGEFKKCQAIKLFNLIQQVTTNNASTLSVNQLQFFVNVMQENQTFTPLLLNKLNPSGKQLSEDWFSICISQYFQDSVGSYIELITFNKNIHDFLLGAYFRQNPLFKVIKEQFSPPIYDIATLEQYQNQALQFLQNIKFGVSIVFTEEILKMVNHAMSSIYHSYDLFARVGKQIALIQLDSPLLQRIYNQSSNPIFMQDNYKFLTFLTEATVFEDINNKLNQNAYFNNLQFWKIHLKNYFDYIGCQREAIPIRVAIEAFILNYMRICSKFTDFFVDWFSKNPEASQLIISVCHHPQQPLYVKYTLYIFIELIRRSEGNKGKNTVLLTESNIRDLQAYAMNVLKNGASKTIQPSIKLLSQTAKYNLIHYNLDRNLGFILKGLQAGNAQINLAKMILLVFQNSLKYDNSEVYWVFSRSKICIQYIKTQLLKEFSKNNQSLHCTCLQVLYHLAKPQLLSVFEENHLIQSLSDILLKYSVYFATFVSKILLKLSQVSIVKGSQILRSIAGLTLISRLLQFQGTGLDDLMSSFLNGSSIIYYNKFIFQNVLKTIYTLDIFRQKSMPRLYECEKGLEFPNILLKQLEVFLEKVRENKIEKHQLWEQIKFMKSSNLKVIKLIYLITQELMLSQKNKPVLQKKQLFQTRSRLLTRVYAVLTPHQLQIENIPLFIQFYFRFEQPYQKTIFRRLPSTINFQSFKTYSLFIFNKVQLNQQNDIVVGTDPIYNTKTIFFLDEFHHRAEIKSDIDFKKMVKYSFQDENHKYQVCISIKFNQEPNGHDQLDYFNRMTSFTQKQNYNSLRGTTAREPPFGGSLRLDNYSRSRSPTIRNTTSVFLQSPSVPKCQNCRVNPAPNYRFCESCNRRN